MASLKFEEDSYRIRGAIFEVYREMGCGFLEAVYQECLEREFGKQEIPFFNHGTHRIHRKNRTRENTGLLFFPCIPCVPWLMLWMFK